MGISRRKLAELCGLSLATILSVETEQHEARPDIVAKIAKALNVSYEDVVRMEFEPDETFGERLRMARIRSGFSISKLALELDVIRDTISCWERDLNIPRPEMVKRLREVLGEFWVELGLDDFLLGK